MKKHLFFALILFMALSGMAQVATVRPHHDGNHGDASLTVASPRNLDYRFWLYIDDVLQNLDPVHSICINNLGEDSFYIRVELDNPLRNGVSQFVDLRQSQALAIVQADKFFGLEPMQVQVQPEVMMAWIPERPVAVQDEPVAVMSMSSMIFEMSPEDYEDAYQQISNETFDSSKLALAKQVVSSNPMNANQILGICKLFSFESNKLEFAKFAYTYCTDTNRYYLLNEAFSYNSSKRELDEFIKGM